MADGDVWQDDDPLAPEEIPPGRLAALARSARDRLTRWEHVDTLYRVGDVAALLQHIRWQEERIAALGRKDGLA